jgi:putative glutamine amidotransferase
VCVDPISKLASLLECDPEASVRGHEVTHDLNSLNLAVNSSHHQSADVIGDGLRVSARCPEDGVVEALEGTHPGHFVIAVQWHPERSYGGDPVSRALFRAFMRAAILYQQSK